MASDWIFFSKRVNKTPNVMLLFVYFIPLLTVMSDAGEHLHYVSGKGGGGL